MQTGIEDVRLRGPRLDMYPYNCSYVIRLKHWKLLREIRQIDHSHEVFIALNCERIHAQPLRHCSQYSCAILVALCILTGLTLMLFKCVLPSHILMPILHCVLKMDSFWVSQSDITATLMASFIRMLFGLKTLRVYVHTWRDMGGGWKKRSRRGTDPRNQL